jgi:hypothetical protein
MLEMLTAIYVFGSAIWHVSIYIRPSDGSDGGLVHDES